MDGTASMTWDLTLRFVGAWPGQVEVVAHLDLLDQHGLPRDMSVHVRRITRRVAAS
jgi:hypothetical protein